MRNTDNQILEEIIDIDQLIDQLEEEITRNSLLYVISKILIENIEGLHAGDVIDRVRSNLAYSESYIYNTLATSRFIIKVVGRRGFWKFSVEEWSKYRINKVNEKWKPQPLERQFLEMSKVSMNKKNRITNDQFGNLSKNIFIEKLWRNSAHTIYNSAKKMASGSLEIIDYFQSSYFALEMVQRKYDVTQGKSISGYFYRQLISLFLRLKRDYSSMIRIPAWRYQELLKLDTDLSKSDFSKMKQLDSLLETEYNSWKTNYISFELVYAYQQMDYILDENIRLTCFRAFSNSVDVEFSNTIHPSFIDVEEPPNIGYDELLYEDIYDISNDCHKHLEDLWEYLDEKIRAIPYSEVLKHRFGFYGVDGKGRPPTLENVSRQYNVTRSRIEQIEKKALRKSIEYFEKKGYRIEDFL